MRETLAVGVSPRKNVQNAFTWGVQFENKDSITEPNRNEKIDASLLSFSKWFPNQMTSIQNFWIGDNNGAADVGGSVLDADRFNNNLFTLERVQVITASNDRPDPQQWAAATYSRNGVLTTALDDRDGTSSDKVRFLDPAKDFSHVPTQKYLKFTFPMIGGWDGVNIFDQDKAKLLDTAVRREMDDTAQGGKNGPTVAAYRKAMDLMEAKQDVDVQLLAIPGISHPAVTDYAIEATERRFDALFIMDIEEKDEVDAFVTSSLQVPSVTNTVNRFAGRALDSSFAAAYYPSVVISDPATRTNVKAPASAVVLGAFALNDAVAFPWFAPAGFTRGALASALYPGVELLQQNRDDLYTADVNPIIGDVTATAGVTVFGQKTLLAAQSALDRVNVRRLLIDVRRRVRDVARTFLFEPNQASTIAAFQARVQPILASVQAQGGLDRFKVIIDTTTTTQADIENNTIRGRIFLQPTRSVEFVSLDFVVSNNI
jgi:phage tail sheath protein FI